MRLGALLVGRGMWHVGLSAPFVAPQSPPALFGPVPFPKEFLGLDFWGSFGAP